MAAKKAKIGTRRSSLKKKKRSPKIFTWGRRLGVATIVLTAISWVGAWFFLSGANASSSNWVRTKAVAVASDSGFRVENILVEGRKYSDPDILLAVINIEKGDPIFSFNPSEAKTQIEKTDWVKSVRVERRLPDTIYINITEREPLALWQSENGLSLIDNDGEIITRSNLDKFKNLLMVSGENSPKKAKEFISILAAESELEAMIDNVKLIDNRRWNLYLNDGKLIKLPENDMGLAVRNIMLRHVQDGILSSNSITVIDARYQGRLIIRTKLGKVQDYKAALEH